MAHRRSSPTRAGRAAGFWHVAESIGRFGAPCDSSGEGDSLMLVSLALAVLGAALPSGGRCSFLDDPGYVLHEWGTFTTLVGSDGVLLEGLTYDDHQLPSFVRQRAHSPAGFEGVRCKMETPVIYFYSDRERELSVK